MVQVMIPNSLHLELGIVEPLGEKADVAVPMTHTEIALNSRRTQGEMLTIFEEEVMKLYATLSMVWLTLRVLLKRFEASSDETFIKDLERIKSDISDAKAGVGDLVQKPDLYMFSDENGNKFPKEKPFNDFVKREKYAYKMLSAYDSFTRKHHEKFKEIEPDVDELIGYINKLESLKLISRISVLRSQKKSEEISSKAKILHYLVESLYINEQTGARMYLGFLKGELGNLNPDMISAYIATLERQYLELGK